MKLTSYCREVLIQPSRGLVKKLRDHFDNVWNTLDAALFILAITSVVLKCFPETFGAARVVFAANCLVLYIRVLRVFHVRWNLGPKVVIMYRMFPEMMSFMVLLSIFILAYGTASQALISPATSFQWERLPRLLENIIWLPYWQVGGSSRMNGCWQPSLQMYGELSLDRIVPAAQSHCNSAGLCEDFTLYQYVTPVFLSVYLLIGNVMLLNLLIAIFTSVSR